MTMLKLRVGFVFDYFAAFDDDFDVLEDGDVDQRVAIYGDEVGVLAGFDGANAILPGHELGGVDGGGANGFNGRVAAADEAGKFEGVLALLLGAAGVRSGGDLDAEGAGHQQLVLNGFEEVVDPFAVVGAAAGGGEVVGPLVDDADGGDEVDVVFLDEVHG